MVGAKGKRSGPSPAGAREMLRQLRRLISPRAGLAIAWGAARLPVQVRRLTRQSLAIAYGDGLAGPRASSGLDLSDRAELRRRPRSRGKRPRTLRDPGSAANPRCPWS